MKPIRNIRTEISCKQIIIGCKEIMKFIKSSMPSTNIEYCIFAVTLTYFLTILFMLIQHTDGCFNYGFLGYDTTTNLYESHRSLTLNNFFVWNFRHPLFSLSYFPASFINWLINILGNKGVHAYIFMCYSCVIVSLSLVILYKILNSLLQNKGITLLCIILFCSFSHVMFISLQVESFTISLWGILLLIYYFINNSTGNIVLDNFMLCLLSGTTLTNGIKLFIVQYIQSSTFIICIKRFFSSIYLFCILLIPTIFNLCYNIFFLKHNLKFSLIGTTLNFIETNNSKLNVLWNMFLTEPIMFHNQSNIILSGSPETSIYTYPLWGTISLILLYILLIISAVLNRKQKIVQFIIFSLLSDIIICIIAGYGSSEAHLFCAHWFCFIPILIALFYKIIKINKIRYFLSFCIMLLSILLFSWNVSLLYTSIQNLS